MHKEADEPTSNCKLREFQRGARQLSFASLSHSLLQIEIINPTSQAVVFSLSFDLFRFAILELGEGNRQRPVHVRHFFAVRKKK